MTTTPRPPGPRDRAFGLRLPAAMQDDYLGFWSTRRMLVQRFTLTPAAGQGCPFHA